MALEVVAAVDASTGWRRDVDPRCGRAFSFGHASRSSSAISACDVNVRRGVQTTASATGVDAETIHRLVASIVHPTALDLLPVDDDEDNDHEAPTDSLSSPFSGDHSSSSSSGDSSSESSSSTSGGDSSSESSDSDGERGRASNNNGNNNSNNRGGGRKSNDSNNNSNNSNKQDDD
ncbi:hypothetical protein PINS_up011739, partial [Pythium insidiosum]